MDAPVIIPLVGIIMGCSIPIVIMALDYKKKRSIYELHHKERLAAIEKGVEAPALPPELFDGSHKDRKPASHLLKGLIWSAVGIGIFVALRSIEGEDTALLGAIPFAIGIAYLLYYLIEGRKLTAAPEKTETPPAARG
jgi:hypothetical protein